jgi:hypothetical protein
VDTSSLTAPLRATSGSGRFSLPIHQARTVTVLAAPTQPGLFGGSIKVTSGALKHPSADVLITGLAQAGRLSAPTSMSFGKVKIGKTLLKRLKLSNQGAGILHCSVGSLDTPFAVTSGGGEFALFQTQSRTVGITFKPTSTQAAAAKLAITCADPGAQILDVTLSGQGKQ